MKTKFYCKAVFERGSGFGNRLFPWARCLLFSKTHDIPMLSPRWAHFRTGPLRKGGVDLRSYISQIMLVGLFQSGKHSLGGFRKINIERNAIKLSGDAGLDLTLDSAERSLIFEFKGCGNYFADIEGQHQFLLRELRAITRSKWLGVVDSFGEIPIAVNIRRGQDFPDAKNSEDYYSKGPIRTPLKWFVDALELIRRIVGRPLSAYVASDGSESDLRSILRLENVKFVRPGCPISDLLVMSRAKVFIASGGSSFSAWASFFGQMPTITIPGQSLAWFKLFSDDKRYVGEFDPTNPNQEFLAQVVRLFS